MNQETLLYVLVGFLVLAGILVLPLLYQLWRTAEQLTIALRTLNSRLPFILKNVEDITGNLNETTTNVNARVAEVSSALQRVHGFFKLLPECKSRCGFEAGEAPPVPEKCPSRPERRQDVLSRVKHQHQESCAVNSGLCSAGAYTTPGRGAAGGRIF